MSLVPLHSDEVENSRPRADGLGAQWNLHVFLPQVVHVHKIVILDCKTHVVLLPLQKIKPRSEKTFQPEEARDYY